ncbi:MAG: LCP family protein [Oscillospiraceae bacterium]|nr:LCP family protein [Oscillospiraceae bacterium]
MLSSLRNFFIALFISLLGFGISAYFLTGFIDNTMNGFFNPTPTADERNKEEEDPENTNENGEEEDDTDEDLSEFTVLIIGIDDGKSQFEDKDEDEKKEADTIFLVNINAKVKTIMISWLPANMKTEVAGYALRLGAVYTYGEYSGRGGQGMELMKKAVWSYTGLKPDYCIVLDYDSLEVLFDTLGEVEYSIPENMYYKPTPYDITTTDPPTEENDEAENANVYIPENIEDTTNRDIIDLKKGKQMIDGAAAVQLLRYNSYISNEDNMNRTSIQIDFIKEVIRQQMTFENLERAEEIYTEIKEILFPAAEDIKTGEDKKDIKTDFKTDFTEEDFKKYTKTLFSLSEFNIKELKYPSNTAEKTENGILFFYPDIKAAVNRYKDYRKVEITQITETDETAGITENTTE